MNTLESTSRCWYMASRLSEMLATTPALSAEETFEMLAGARLFPSLVPHSPNNPAIPASRAGHFIQDDAGEELANVVGG